MKENELTGTSHGTHGDRLTTTRSTSHTDEHGDIHSESTVTDHEGTIIRTSMHVDQFGRMTLTFHATDPEGTATTTVFDLVERTPSGAVSRTQ